MSGLRMSLDQLGAALRRQAEQKLFDTAPRNRGSLLRKLSDPEERLAFHLHAEGIKGWRREFRFHKERKWKVDFAFPEERLAVEVEGISGGAGTRHQRAGGFIKDTRKYNELTIAGWRLLRFVPSDVKRGYAINTIKRALGLVS